MFSVKEKHKIAQVIEDCLLALNHPEMPKEKPYFKIRVLGKESSSYAYIEPNWIFENKKPDINPWNENAREYFNKN